MKKQITFNRLLHKDKLMMVVSLILAIALWAWADYEQGALHDMTVSNVTVNVNLSNTAKNYGLRIAEGANVKATVKVVGTRKDLRNLREGSIHIETSESVTNVEDCEKPLLLNVELPATVSTKCRIEDVSGTSITSENGRYYLKVVAKVLSSVDFALSSDQVMMSHLSPEDSERMRFGTLEITGIADDEKNVTIEGWQENVKRVKKVYAVISESGTLSKIGRFKAKLVAYDENGDEVEGITFTTPVGGEVDVIVPVVVYRQETLTVTEAANVPSALVDKLVVSPATLELGELPEKQVLDTYVDQIRQSLTVNFDSWLAEENKPITQTVVTLKEKDVVEQKDGVYLDRAPNRITISLNVEGYTNQTKEIALGDNVMIECDEGYTAELLSTSIQVKLCGPKAELEGIDAGDIRLVVDAKGQSEGDHKVSVRPMVERDDTWVYYGSEDDAMVYEIEYTIVKAEPVAAAE